ncbi:MFS general substrate transporter [Dendrothele bispora CBS 962.96]|uniref:MFS general substrate transporter n=1 Tax=Dendrothele bispora (strain CBS 962.96) TaxID=1314807 RepID=A0A4S8LDR3_DENBC|nr:MFS general substrate transporter [Dendrothele bispora CBS 962.96]
MIVCLNDIETDMNQDPTIVQWVLTAFNLTFGSFLLLSGRISDIYHPKPIFILGFFIVGIFGIGAGFVHNIIGLIIIRAIQGIGASMTIPSAISMLTSAYTDPESRGIALTFFASAGTLGLCLGFVIGGVIVQFASWRWVFWGIACVAVPISLASIWLIPVPSLRMNSKGKKMDYPGVFSLTASIILLIFAFSQAPTVGWGTARVLAPLIVALLVLCIFFFWQTRLSDQSALIPSKMWFIPNFLILILVSFSNQIYFIGPVVLYSNYYPIHYGWSPLTIGLHFLPTGIVSGIICIIFPRQILRLPPKTVLVAGQAMAGLFGILYAFAYTRERYWSFTFPAMILATAGSSVTYLVSNVGVITSVPVDKVGVGSAVFNAAQQVGSAVNVAIVTTILVETTKQNPQTDQEAYHGVSSAIWWIVAIGCAEAVASAIFFKPRKNSLEGDGSGAEEKEKLSEEAQSGGTAGTV